MDYKLRMLRRWLHRIRFSYRRDRQMPAASPEVMLSRRPRVTLTNNFAS